MYHLNFLFIFTFWLPMVVSKSLRLRLSGHPNILGADVFRFNAELTNTGNEPLTLLNDPNTVLAPSWKTDIFAVTCRATGKLASFQGVSVRWNPPEILEDAQITKIQVGETIKIEQNLSSVYNFTLSGPGVYDITPISHTFLAISPAGSVESIVADVSGSHHMWLWGNTASTKAN
ncbi:hypothetical protein FRC02_006353 [Tulasnella sp. 418]|nr:hypothetical protein FRC02_006353 [Tulasnella sp. 418]